MPAEDEGKEGGAGSSQESLRSRSGLGEERGQEGGLERESLRLQGSLDTTWPHSAERTRAQTACGEAGGSGGSDRLQCLTSLLLHEAAPDLDVGVLEAISQRGSSKQPFKGDQVGCLHG